MTRRRLLGIALAWWLAADAAQGAALESGFRNPPDSAKPHTWWHWMDGNITREGITKDLEEMKRVGLGGAQIFNVAVGIPAGPVKFMSPEWRRLFKHAVQTADRLGLKLCAHNCAGWSSSGGPWIRPEQAMQMLVWSVTRVRGPKRISLVLPQPETRLGFYRDIAVLAFPTPPADEVRMADAKPKVSTSAPHGDPLAAVDGQPRTSVSLPAGRPHRPCFILLQFDRPFPARALHLAIRGPGGYAGVLEASDDGKTFRAVRKFSAPRFMYTRSDWTVSFQPVSARFYRIRFTRMGYRRRAIRVAELELLRGARIDGWQGKAAFCRLNVRPRAAVNEPPADAVIPKSRIVNLTARMDARGRLTWDAPAGDWTIMRFGYTPTGKKNHPAPASGLGLECDKMSRAAVDAHWRGMMAKVLSDMGPLAGKTFNNVLIDSYEVGCQNWTPRFRAEFLARRGYDPIPFLPAAAGRVVESLDASERFLWDFRRTIGELFADAYYGHFAELAHQHGLMFSAEAYGSGPFDNLVCATRADIPMTEFWVGSRGPSASCRQAASAAHVYGRKFVGAESFTASPERGAWRNHPYALKMLGDRMFCAGVNRFIFHRYAHQPWVNRRPGMTMGRWGFHFEWPITWWRQAPAWTRYLARCQFLLQSGQYVADLCYLTSEGSPSSPPTRAGLRPRPPDGYAFDYCTPEALLTRVSVRGGRLVLPDGMSYRVLVLPEDRVMTPRLLRKVAALAKAGAVVAGPKPVRSPSLQDYPAADREVQALAREMWGEGDGKKVLERRYGKGRVVCGKPLEQVLAELGLAPDFEYKGSWAASRVAWIHRAADGADFYFVSNQQHRPDVVECAFRVAGRAPELWRPDTGRIERAAVYRVEAGRTRLRLWLPPAGSVFVVFRRAAGPDYLVSATRNGEPLARIEPPRAKSLRITKAEYGVFETELADMTDVTAILQRRVKGNKLRVLASNRLAGDPAPNVVKDLWVEYEIDGQVRRKRVREGQMLEIPEKGAAGRLVVRKAFYGIIPSAGPRPPRRAVVDVTRALQARVKDGRLEVAVSNRLAGDPCYGVVKTLRVEGVMDGRPFRKTVRENELLVIPDGSESGRLAAQAPAADVTVDAAGRLALTAWRPGRYELTSAADRRWRVEVKDVPAAIPIAGPWLVRFPPGWRAPAEVRFERLVSWSERPEPGVKYFSGTATYVKDVNLPADALAPDRRFVLDLGDVRVIAGLRVNGRDFGVLWKPPFWTDVTSALRPGRNRLEVRVTNLWPNRLIGDEQLPDDCVWAGDRLAKWPDWLLQGKPRPSGRLTFATWRHYHKDSPLLPSGLLGPVVLRVGLARNVR